MAEKSEELEIKEEKTELASDAGNTVPEAGEAKPAAEDIKPEAPAEDEKKDETPEKSGDEPSSPEEKSGSEEEKEEKPQETKEPKEPQEKKPSGTAGFIVSVALPLLVICAVTAALMALVNGLTIDRINENKNAATREAINRIYPAFDSLESVAEAPDLPVTEVFRLIKDGDTLGYCASVEPKGFNGAIEMMVGMSPKGVITGVEIISHSETPGVGARADDPQYLDGYDGLSGKISFGDGIDALSGATISSKAILSGVNAAAEIIGDIAGIETQQTPDEGEADPSQIQAEPLTDETGEEAGQ
ncbi:MAG: RnfABCDGE type electron transport complex subunit G [Clostridia bacterium]|nr:RnfABCDGE type electron transport complex subunit G [Clostridia bacterium]